MKEFSCKLCGKAMGGMSKGSIRNGYVILCDGCWARADAAMQMAELAIKGAPGRHSDTPEFLKDLFDGFDKGKS
jgi:hypothetical protein